ncbi:hypothetical protein [Paraburkholderia sp. 2C]
MVVYASESPKLPRTGRSCRFSAVLDRTSRKDIECDPAECVDQGRRFIEAIDAVKFHAAGFKESIASFNADLFDRFDAIGRESGAKHIDAPGAGIAKVGERLARRWRRTFNGNGPLLRDKRTAFAATVNGISNAPLLLDYPPCELRRRRQCRSRVSAPAWHRRAGDGNCLGCDFLHTTPGAHEGAGTTVSFAN